MYFNPLRPKLTSDNRNELTLNLLKREILPIKSKTPAKSGNPVSPRFAGFNPNTDIH